MPTARWRCRSVISASGWSFRSWRLRRLYVLCLNVVKKDGYRRYHARVNQALMHNCSIIYDADEEFGTVLVVNTECRVTTDLLSALALSKSVVFLD